MKFIILGAMRLQCDGFLMLYFRECVNLCKKLYTFTNHDGDVCAHADLGQDSRPWMELTIASFVRQRGEWYGGWISVTWRTKVSTSHNSARATRRRLNCGWCEQWVLMQSVRIVLFESYKWILLSLHSTVHYTKLHILWHTRNNFLRAYFRKFIPKLNYVKLCLLVRACRPAYIHRRNLS